MLGIQIIVNLESPIISEQGRLKFSNIKHALVYSAYFIETYISLFMLNIIYISIYD